MHAKEPGNIAHKNYQSSILSASIRYRSAFRNYLIHIGVIILFLAAGCAHHIPIAADSVQAVYLAEKKEEDILHRFAPIFKVYDYHQQYNRIGRPVALQGKNGEEQIAIDTDRPAIYGGKMTFSTAKGLYANLIYRVHFPAVPFSLIPFNLTAGKNPGLMLIITLNRRDEPLLVTSVHTCGCYKALVATTALLGKAFPEKRQGKQGAQKVFGEHLPMVIDYRASREQRLLVGLRPGVHRVMTLQVIDALKVVSTIMCEIILCHIFHKWQVGGNFTYGFRPPVDFHL